MPDRPTRKLTIEIPEEWALNLEALVDGVYVVDVEDVLVKLADHAQQAVYRPGAWERAWLEQAFGDRWQENLEPDTERTAGDGSVVFDRVKRRR